MRQNNAKKRKNPTNNAKLKGRMREYGLTLEKTAALLGHSINYVQARLRGVFPWDLNEIEILSQAMEIRTIEEFRDIFLARSPNFVVQKGA